MKMMFLKHALWRYWKRFGTAKKLFENNVSKAYILTVLETIWNCRENEIKDGKLCIVTGFERFGVAEKMETRMVNCALWRYLKRFGSFMSILVGTDPSPLGLHFLLHFWVYTFFLLSRKHVATPVIL